MPGNLSSLAPLDDVEVVSKMWITGITNRTKSKDIRLKVVAKWVRIVAKLDKAMFKLHATFRITVDV